jgi:hypothetical protein
MISYKSINKGLNEFFFVPKPTESIALFRILWCSMLFIYFLFDVGNIEYIYGPHAILSLKTVQSQFPQVHLNLFNMLGVSHEVLYVFFGVYGVALLMSIIGFHTRISLITVLCCMVSLHHRNIWVTSSSETLMRIMMILLVCSPCGHSLSVDAYLDKNIIRRNWAPWALRLMQIQISVVYLCTVWQKLKGETWFDGTAVYYATRFESMKNFPVPYILDNLAILKMLTWSTLIIEASLGLLVWIKEFRIPVIILGILLHLGIEYTMSIPFFEWVMITSLCIYMTPLEGRALAKRFMQKIDFKSRKPKYVEVGDSV